MNIALIIFCICGSILNLLTCKKLREWKNYYNPHAYLCLTIFLCIIMSWAMVILNILNDDFYVPVSIYHNCHEYERITFEEEYFDKDGNKIDITNMTPEEYHNNVQVHHTYKVYTCVKCGHIRKEQLQ